MVKKGNLAVICGPMFSGKSRELIRLMHIAEIAGQETVVFKPRIDTRYSYDDVSSHDGIRKKAHSVDTAREVLSILLGYPRLPEVVAIDEGQFFDRGLPPVCLWLVDQGCRVVVAGLDRNFRGEPFGTIPDLLACADEVVKLRAVCMRCKDPRVTAVLPQRLVDGRPAPYDSPEVMVGGAEAYEARCLDCHEVPGKPDYGALLQAIIAG
ncbi:MAG TPA: thymidine kinase [Chloroflexota bacterium]|nr:thymidine kinase [Chloroflexota bacterium]